MPSFSYCSIALLARLITDRYYCQNVQIVIQYSFKWPQSICENSSLSNVYFSRLLWYKMQVFTTRFDFLRTEIRKRVQFYTVELEGFIYLFIYLFIYSLLDTRALNLLELSVKTEILGIDFRSKEIWKYWLKNKKIKNWFLLHPRKKLYILVIVKNHVCSLMLTVPVFDFVESVFCARWSRYQSKISKLSVISKRLLS